MRRPSPLPSPPADQSAPAAPNPGSAVPALSDTADAAGSDAARPAVGADPALGPESADATQAPDSAPEGVDEQATAPIIPITSPTPLQRPSALPVGLGAEGAADRADTAETPPVGLRDVWRATRARRKALRAEVRRFTVRQRRRRALWIGVAASIAVLVLATLGAAYSPLLAVDTIVVEGASQLDAAAVEDALAGQLGTPLPLVDESAVKAALVAFPLVESYALEARPPHELVVRIVERMPIGLIQSRAGYTLVDAAGVALSTTPDPVPGSPVLTVKGGSDSAAFDALGQVMRALPDAIRAQVTAAAASTPDDVTLTLGGTNTQVVWGSADESALKAAVLEKIMAARPPASVSVYDVSSPRAAVVG